MQREIHTIIYKHLGETPLAAMERYRTERIESATQAEERLYWQQVPLTYAGRLDPLAEGELLVLIGDECKRKAEYLGLDKEYQIEIVFGITTDTYDALGLVLEVGPTIEVSPLLDLTRYIGVYTQPYPSYSSKTVDGTALHELARIGELPQEMPTKRVEIYELEQMQGSTTSISIEELKSRIFRNIDLVKGDFRQDAIRRRWDEVLPTPGVNPRRQRLGLTKLRVKCSSGTYMRSLAYRIGQDLGCGAFALSITRTKIFDIPARR